MKSSNETKKYKKYYIILTLISIALVFGPLIGYIIYGYIVSGTVQKLTLTGTVMAAIVLTVISVLFKKNIRSSIFILILGIYMAISKIQVLIIILSISTMLDEFLITPARKVFRDKYRINKEMDKRIGGADEESRTGSN